MTYLPEKTFVLCTRDGVSEIKTSMLERPWEHPDTFVAVPACDSLELEGLDQLTTPRLSCIRLGVPPGKGDVQLYMLPDVSERDIRLRMFLQHESLTDLYRQLQLAIQLGSMDTTALQTCIRLERYKKPWENLPDSFSDISMVKSSNLPVPELDPLTHTIPYQLVESIFQLLESEEMGRVISIKNDGTCGLTNHLISCLVEHPDYYYYIWSHRSMWKRALKLSSTLSMIMAQLLHSEYLGGLDSIKSKMYLDNLTQLPIIPMDMGNYKSNPYYLPLGRQSLPLLQRYTGPVKTGIVSSVVFLQRLELFIGCETILNGLELDRIGITGGIMPAIIPRWNPLVNGYSEHLDGVNPTSSQLSEYYRQYYAESGLDLVCNTGDEREYLALVSRIYEQLKHNVQDEEMTISAAHYITLFAPPEEEMSDSDEEEYDNDSENDDPLQALFCPDSAIARAYPKRVKELCPDWIVNIKRSAERGTGQAIGDVKIGRVTYHATREIQFTCQSDLLHGPVKIRNIDPRAGGSLYRHCSLHHYAPVRAIYTNGQCLLTPSALLSYLTLTINESRNRATDPLVELSKYWSRGYSMPLSDDERDLLATRVSLTPTTVPTCPVPRIKHKNVIYASK